MFTLTFFNTKWREAWNKSKYADSCYHGIVILSEVKTLEPIMWQQRALLMLGQSAFSVINLMALPFILLSPLRWVQIKYSFQAYWNINADKIVDDVKINFQQYYREVLMNYWTFVSLLPSAAIDILKFPFVAAAAITMEFDLDLPCVRFPLLPRIRDLFSMAFSLDLLPGTTQAELYDEIITKMQNSCVKFIFLHTFLKLVSICFLPFCVLTPSAWRSQIHSTSHLNENYREFTGIITKSAGMDVLM